jgi:hypothetical protein
MDRCGSNFQNPVNFERALYMAKTIEVIGTEIRILTVKQEDYISLTDMLKAKDGDFFISDWLRNRNTVEFLGIWERVYNPNFDALAKSPYHPSTSSGRTDFGLVTY